MAVEMFVGFLAYYVPVIVSGLVFIFVIDNLILNIETTSMRMVGATLFLTGIICMFTHLHYWLTQKEAFYFQQGEFASKLSQDWHRLLFLGIVLIMAWVMCYCDPDERKKGARTFFFSVLLITVLLSSSIWGMIARFG